MDKIREGPWPHRIGRTTREMFTQIHKHPTSAVLWEPVQGHGGLPVGGDVSAFDLEVE